MASFTTQAIVSTMGSHVLQDWTLETVMPVLGDELGLAMVAEADPRHIANVVRYALLYSYGGLWLDHDVLPLEDLRSDGPWTAGFRAPSYRREGCAMFFPEPGHPMLAELLNAATAEPELEEIRTWGDAHPRVLPRVPQTSLYRSGARVLTEVGRNYPLVRIEDAVLPFDSTGRLVNRRRPKAVHLWEGSRR